MNKNNKLSDVQSVSIGNDTRIWQYVVILEGAQIGNNCNICAHTFIENDVVIGNNVTVKCGVYIWDGVTIEDNVQIGPNVTFTNDKYPRAKQPFKRRRTLIKENASIGAGAVLLCGIVIGESAMIGAGAVVTKDVPAFTLWIGNPAKHAGYITREGIILSLHLKNKDGVQYKIYNGEPVL
ncbi:MAG: N-acetyltransferase [Bacteroidetes bacterium]|nr:MAG: N-acetyltransferase [Bacteroidota bacterium]